MTDLLAKVAEIEALLVNEEDHGDLVELLLTAAPALLEAARQNKRRGELLRNASSLLQEYADMLFDSGTAIGEDDAHYWDGTEPEQEAVWRKYISAIEDIAKELT